MVLIKSSKCFGWKKFKDLYYYINILLSGALFWSIVDLDFNERDWINQRKKYKEVREPFLKQKSNFIYNIKNGTSIVLHFQIYFAVYTITNSCNGLFLQLK